MICDPTLCSQHFGVELAYYQHLAPFLTGVTFGARWNSRYEGNTSSCVKGFRDVPLRTEIHVAYCAVDRFICAVEKLKISRHTFEDVQGNYVCEVGESVGLNGRYVVEGLLATRLVGESRGKKRRKCS